MANQSVIAAKPSPTLWINERVQALRQAGETVYHFGFGQSPFPVPSRVVAALQQHAHRKEYLPVKGLQPLREEVASFLSRTRQIDVDAEQILIGPGSKELIYLTQSCLEGTAYLPSPSWVSYEPQAHYSRHLVRWLPDAGWKLQVDTINEQTTDRGYMIFNYPANPTGVSFQEEELAELAVAFRKKNLVVIADEIYGMLHYDGRSSSLAQHYEEGTIITSGLSKWAGAGGWRLGIAAFPKALSDLQHEVTVMASETFSCVATPIQLAAIEAYRESAEINEYLQQVRAILGRIATYVHETLERNEISCVAPQGGFYLFPDFGHYRERLEVSTSMEFCTLLLEQCNIAMLPGAAFGRPEHELSTRMAFVDFDGAAALANTASIGEEDWLRRCAPNVVEGMERLIAFLKKN